MGMDLLQRHGRCARDAARSAAGRGVCWRVGITGGSTILHQIAYLGSTRVALLEPVLKRSQGHLNRTACEFCVLVLWVLAQQCVGQPGFAKAGARLLLVEFDSHHLVQPRVRTVRGADHVLTEKDLVFQFLIARSRCCSLCGVISPRWVRVSHVWFCLTVNTSSITAMLRA